jgi:hypothetical protein
MTGGGYGYAQTISTSGNYEMWTVFNNTSDTSGDVGNLTKFVVSDGLILASTGDTYLINGISSDTVNSYVITLWNISAYHHG